jgi:DUF1707 SHOCT-like domain
MAAADDDKVPGPGSRGHLRAAHADRERVVGVLKTAFVRGLLDKQEFDERVTRAFASRTYAELAVVTADLPADLPAAAPPPPAPVRKAEGQKEEWLTMKRAAAVSALLLAVVGLVAGLGWAFQNPGVLVIASPLAFVAWTCVSGSLVVEAWSRRRSQPRLPQAPGPGRRALGGPKAGPKARRPRRSPGPGDLTLAVRV